MIRPFTRAHGLEVHFWGSSVRQCSSHPFRQASGLTTIRWIEECGCRSVIVPEVQARQRRLFLLSNSLEGGSIRLLVNNLTRVAVPLGPIPILGILNLGAVLDGTIAVRSSERSDRTFHSSNSRTSSFNTAYPCRLSCIERNNMGSFRSTRTRLSARRSALEAVGRRSRAIILSQRTLSTSTSYYIVPYPRS